MFSGVFCRAFENMKNIFETCIVHKSIISSWIMNREYFLRLCFQIGRIVLKNWFLRIVFENVTKRPSSFLID